MAYSTISRNKFGDCSQCPRKNTGVVKVGKLTYCTQCHSHNKTLEQLDRQKKRNALRVDSAKVRGLGNMVESELMESRNNMIAQLDFLVSRYVRISAANEEGYLNCYTCNDRILWKDAQCSHFIKRGANMVLRFDIRFNTRPACKTCNEHKDGNLEAYAANLEIEQKGVVEMLQERGRQVERFELHELKQLVIDMQAKVNLVSAKLKNINH